MSTTVTIPPGEVPSSPAHAAEGFPASSPPAAETPAAFDSTEEDPEELEDLTPVTSSSPNTSPPPQKSQTPPPPAVPSPPPFMNSISELRDLSSSLSVFFQCLDDLHSHIDSIKSAILSKLPPETLASSTTVEIAPPPLPIVQSTTHVAQSSAAITHPDPSAAEMILVPSITPEEKKTEGEKDSLSELEGLCRTMCNRGIRRYISAHLSDREKLREEVPKALKYAVSVSKLVFDCLGKFYLQGTKAYAKNSPMISSRDASIFMLECYLLSMGMEGVDMAIEKSVKESAEDAAFHWKRRLVAEGGLAKANLVDARGLLYLIACFGVPDSFKREDVRDLVVAANAKEIVDVLKKSQLLMDKISGVIEGMMKNKMKVDAVDFAYTFGLEERFDPQIILISYLQECKEALKRPKKGSQGSPAALNEANKKQLDALKSVRKCLLRHKVDPAKLLPGWQIGESISTLEREVAEFARRSEDKSPQKRKASEPESSSKSKSKEAKRSRYSNQGPSQHQATGHDSRRNGLPNHDSRRNGLPNHVVNYSAPSSVIYGGPGAGLLPESMISCGIGLGQSVSRAAPILTNPYAVGGHGSVLVDSTGQVLGRSEPYMYDEALIEKYAAQPPLVGLTSLYRAPTSAAVTNSPSVGPGNRTPGSDLYQFADSVAERESYTSNTTRAVGGIPTGMLSHHSYMYHHQV